MDLSIVNASLMCGPPENGFTFAMRQVFKGGYYPLNPSHPNFNEELIYLVKHNKVDCVFLQIQTPHVITEETAKEIAKHSFVINWSGDIRAESPPQWYLDIGKHIQLSAFSNMKDVLGCREHGIAAEWLECGFNPDIFRKYEDAPPTKEIVAHFNDYGTNAFPLSQYRIDIVTALRNEFGDRFGVFGNFPGAVTNFNSDQVTEAKNYSAAKIAINCSHFCTPKYSSDRLSRITGTGGAACVSHYFPGIEEMYDLGNHLYVFNNIQDLLILCHSLLNNDEERERIAKSAQKHAIENYSFQKMCENTKLLYLNYHEKEN